MQWVLILCLGIFHAILVRYYTNPWFHFCPKTVKRLQRDTFYPHWGVSCSHGLRQHCSISSANKLYETRYSVNNRYNTLYDVQLQETDRRAGGVITQRFHTVNSMSWSLVFLLNHSNLHMLTFFFSCRAKPFTFYPFTVALNDTELLRNNLSLYISQTALSSVLNF